MSSPSKCPNPVCTFLFDPTQVPPGAVIACPRCNLRFTLAPSAPIYPGYAPMPGYGAPPAPPPEEPVSTFTEDLFASVEEAAPPVSASGGKKASAPRSKGKRPLPPNGEPPRKAKGKYGSLISILVATGIVFSIAVVFTVIFVLSRLNKGNRNVDETSTEMKFPDFNLQFKKPAEDSGWSKHDTTRANFNASLFGYLRGEEAAPTAWIVGDARKFGYAARPSDLEERMKELLNENFENVTESENPVEDTLCGLAGKRYQYRATHKKTGDSVFVEVHTAANKSIGIWVYAWALERDFTGQANAFQSVRAGLQILKAGDTAIEVASTTKSHRSKSGLFTIKNSDGLWVKKDPATDLDANGTLWLKGTAKSSAAKNRPSPVDLVVVEVDPSGDPKEQALDIVKKSLPLGEPTIEELTGEPTGDPAAGELNPVTTVTRLKVRYKGADNSVNKLMVFSAVESGGKLVVAYVGCQLKDLPYWEQRLMQIIGSLAPRAK